MKQAIGRACFQSWKTWYLLTHAYSSLLPGMQFSVSAVLIHVYKELLSPPETSTHPTILTPGKENN